jgi:tryptophan synthase alpha chain
MSALAKFIIKERQSKSILLMTHVIYGYPTIETSLEMMRIILQKDVSILEVQFPFSDPVADGPIITNGCHKALENKPNLDQCIKDISDLADEFPNSKVLLMSYLNPLLQYGFDALAKAMSPAIAGVIVPDLPIDQSKMVAPLVAANIDPIWLIIPNMDPARMALVCEQAQGLLYCVSRKGVTGKSSSKSNASGQSLETYLAGIRALTTVPLALGFGISSAQQVSEIVGEADVAVVGSALLAAFQRAGIEGFSEKITELVSLG